MVLHWRAASLSAAEVRESGRVRALVRVPELVPELELGLAPEMQQAWALASRRVLVAVRAPEREGQAVRMIPRRLRRNL